MDSRIEGDELLGPRQEEGHHVVGDLLGAVVGHVDHGDPLLGRRFEIDVVVADAVTGHGLAPAHGFQNPSSDGDQAVEDDVGLARQLDDLFLGAATPPPDVDAGFAQELSLEGCGHAFGVGIGVDGERSSSHAGHDTTPARGSCPPNPPAPGPR